jgi:hypothetical protein
MGRVTKRVLGRLDHIIGVDRPGHEAIVDRVPDRATEMERALQCLHSVPSVWDAPQARQGALIIPATGY